MLKRSLFAPFITLSVVVVTIAGLKVAAKSCGPHSPLRTQTESDLSGWKLNQECYASGEYEVSACKQGIRIDNRKTGLSLVSQSPHWKAAYINDSLKAYHPAEVDTLNQDINRFAAMAGAPVFYDVPLKLVKIEKTDITVERYESPPEFAAKQNSLMNNKLVSYNAAIKVYLAVWKNDLPPIESRMLCRMYALPLVKGIPLGLVSMNCNKHTHSDLTLVSRKHMTFQPSIFNVPKDYHLAKSIADLKQAKATDAGIKMMLQNMSDPTDLSKPQSTQKAIERK